MFEELERIYERPEPFQFYTAEDLWTDEHTSKQMLSYHLNEVLDVSSRNHEFIDRSAEWIASRFRVGKKTCIADFGCGPGLYATRLAKLGADVTGIDFSRNSIEYARATATREKLKIRYEIGNYLDYETVDRFDLITMIMCDFCALSPLQRKSLLEKFRRMLKPGGSVLLDVYSLRGFARKREEASCELNQLNGFWSPKRYYGFMNVFKYFEEKVSLDKFTIVEAHRIRQVYNWIQYFSPEALKSEFTGAGFRIGELYSDVAGTPFDPEAGEFAVVAVPTQSDADQSL